MTRRRRLAALLLCASVPASAQWEVRPLVSVSALAPPVPAAAAPASPLPAASSALVPALAAPSILVAPAPVSAVVIAPGAAPAAAPMPVAVRAAALNAALADFGRADVAKASGDDARGAGDALMRRALGEDAAAVAVLAAPADAPAAPRPSGLAPASAPARRSVYLLSKPMRETVALGPLSLLAHAGYALAWEAFKAWLGWKATGSPMGALAVLAVELPFSPAMATARSLIDLGQRYWRRKLAVLKEIARVPGVERVRVLTTGEARFWGPIARRKENTGLIFVESSGELGRDFGRFGTPIPVSEDQGVRLRLIKDGEEAGPSWTTPLKALLDGEPIPPAQAAAWREGLHEHAKRPLERVVSLSEGKGLRLDASLVGADGTETPLGAIAYGDPARTLIGQGRLDRLRVWLGRERPARSIHLSDSAVERPGQARASGLLGRLARAWRRAAGRLIAAPERP